MLAKCLVVLQPKVILFSTWERKLQFTRRKETQPWLIRKVIQILIDRRSIEVGINTVGIKFRWAQIKMSKTSNALTELHTKSLIRPLQASRKSCLIRLWASHTLKSRWPICLSWRNTQETTWKTKERFRDTERTYLNTNKIS